MATSSSSEDVKMLFRRFGGEAGTYQEVVRERNAEASRVKWPMLNSVEPMQALNAPAVHQMVRTSKVRHAVEEPQPSLQPPPSAPAPSAPAPSARYSASPVPAAAPSGPLRRLGTASAQTPDPQAREKTDRVTHPAPQPQAAKPGAASALAGRWGATPERADGSAPVVARTAAPDSLSSLFDRISGTGQPAAAPVKKSLFKDRLK